jgi:hypothetical protein
MSQAGFTPIKLYSSTTPTAVPTAGNLEQGELAINTADGKIFYEDSSGVVQVLATKDAAAGNFTTLDATNVVATQVDITAQGDLRLQDTTGGQFVALQAPGTIATSYTLTLPVDDGTSGQALITDGSGVLSWSTAASGDVYGPASATDNAIARYDGTTGKIIQNSSVTIADDGATVIAANSASAGLQITQIGAGNALLVEDSANPDASPFVVDTTGIILSGQTTKAQYNHYTPDNKLQIANTTSAVIQTATFENSISGATYSIAKSRSGTIGTNTVVQNNDALGSFVFLGADGTGYIKAAEINAEVDGTPGTNDMPGRLVFSTTANGASITTERMRIANSGVISLGAAPDSESLRVTPVASAVNYLEAQGAATGFGATLRTQGSDANVAMTLITKGTGNYTFYTNNSISQFVVAHTASAVNYLQVTGGATGGNAALTAQGTDTNVNIYYGTKGSGLHYFATGTGQGQFAVAHTASAVNYLQVTGGATGNAATMSAAGTDTNVPISFVSKGTGDIRFTTNALERMRITSSGAVGIGTSTPAGSLQVVGGILARGGAPGGLGVNNNGYAFSGNGGDADSGMYSSADGQLEFYVNSVELMRINSSANRVLFIGSASRGGSGYAVASPDDSIANAIRAGGYIEWQSDIGSIGTNYFVSDIRKKQNIQPSTTSALPVINAIELIEFDFAEGSGEEGHVDVGVSAQQLQTVNEQFVAELSDGTLMVRDPKIFPYLIKAIQEQQAIISAMEARLAALEA